VTLTRSRKVGLVDGLGGELPDVQPDVPFDGFQIAATAEAYLPSDVSATTQARPLDPYFSEVPNQTAQSKASPPIPCLDAAPLIKGGLLPMQGNR
jgi:hypothetical protein